MEPDVSSADLRVFGSVAVGSCGLCLYFSYSMRSLDWVCCWLIMGKRKAPGLVPGACWGFLILLQEDFFAAALAFGAKEVFVIFDEIDNAGVGHA
ncbi:MAG: hypothetical protein RI897_3579 [Verrucomicrobiota bacterium]